MMSSINVHGTRPTDTFSATPSEGESRINFILDLNKSVQEHGTTPSRVDVVRYKLWSVSGVIRICSVHIKSLHLGFLLISKILIKLYYIVVEFQELCHITQSNLVGLSREGSDL